MRALQQSTGTTILVGPFVNFDDGVTPTTGLAGTMTVYLSKAGGALAARNSATAITADATLTNWYLVPLDATDTNTLGTLDVIVQSAASHVPVFPTFEVKAAAPFAALGAGTGAGLPAAVQSIAASAITATSIASNAITNAKIATDAIGAAQIAANAIGSSEIATGAITAAKFAASAITSTVIANDAITAAKIAASAITASEAPLLANLDAAVSSRAVAGDSMALTAGAVDAVWDEPTAGHVTAGTTAVALTDVLADTAAIQPTVATNLDVASSTLATAAALATVDGNVDAILVDTAAIQPTVAANLDAAVSSRAVAGDSMALTAAAVDAVWDEPTAGHVTAGSFAVTATDTLADTAAIQPLVDVASSTLATAAALATVDGNVDAILVDTAAMQPTVATNLDAAVSSRAAAGDAMALTTGAVDAIWDEDIVAAHGTADTAGLTLSELTKRAVTLSTAAIDGSIIGQLVDDGTAVYDRTTDSLQALADSGGGGPTASQIADAVWDEATAGHVTAGSYGVLATDVLTDTAAMQPNIDVASSTLATAAALATVDGNVDAILVDTAAIQPTVAANLDAAVSSRAVAGDSMALTAAAVDAIWDEDIVAAHGTADTAGLIVSELTKRAVTLSTAAVDGSIIGQIVDDGTAVYDRTTDSLQAIADSGGGGPTAAQIADAVWDEATAGHATAGSFAVVATDTLADTAAIQPLVDVASSTLATAAALTTVDSNVDAILVDTAAIDAVTASTLDAAISSRAVAGDSMALTAAAVDAIWDEDIVAAHGTADTAGLTLSELTKRAVTLSTAAVDGSIIGQIVDDGTAVYDRTTDSLQVLADTGGGGPTANQIADAVWDEDIVAAHSTSDTAGLIVSELTKRAVTLSTAAVDGSIIGQMVDDGTAVFDRTTDSLQAIADTGGGGPSAAQIADAVWDEATAGHVTAGSFGVAATDTLADTAAIQPLVDVASSTLATAAALATVDGNVDAILVDTAAMQPTIATNLDAAVSTRAVAGDSMALTTAAVDAVWDEPTAGHVTAGTTAVALTDVLADTAAIQPTVATNLDAAVSTRASATALTTVDANVDAILVDTAAMQPAIATNLDVAVSTRAVAGDAMSLTAAAVDLVWDEPTAGHVTAGTTAVALTDVLADTAAMQPTIAATLDAAISTRQAAGAVALTAAAVDAIWDEAIAGHLGVGSVGEALDTASAGGGASAGAIADAVWDENIVAAHGTADTAGLLMRALGAAISQRANNATLHALLGVADSAGVDLPAQVDTELTATHGTGVWNGTGGGGSDWTSTERDQIRFRLALDGVQATPATATGTIEDILTDTATIEPLVSTNVDATVSSRAEARGEIQVGVTYDNASGNIDVNLWLEEDIGQVTGTLSNGRVTLYSSAGTLLQATLTDVAPDAQGVFRLTFADPGFVVGENATYMIVTIDDTGPPVRTYSSVVGITFSRLV